MPTVREATFDVLRAHGLTTLFANPGSTEISLLSGLPEDLRFVLGLHEGAVISMAAGYAIGRDAPALALVVGAGADSAGGWSALVALAERLGCPVWQEPFGGRAGFPQDHPRFAGHLPADRKRVRERLGAHDAVLVVGTGFLRQYPYQPGRLTETGTRLPV